MKKYLATLGITLAIATSGFAQASAQLIISGTVAPVTTIAIVAQSGYNNLNLANTASAQVVGIATETSNDKAGYKVTLTSLNAGSTAQAFLKGAASANTDTLNYSISYGGTPVTLASGSATVTSVAARTGSGGATKNIAVSYAGTWLAADTYSDTLTLSIAGN